MPHSVLHRRFHYEFSIKNSLHCYLSLIWRKSASLSERSHLIWITQTSRQASHTMDLSTSSVASSSSVPVECMQEVHQWLLHTYLLWAALALHWYSTLSCIRPVQNSVEFFNAYCSSNRAIPFFSVVVLHLQPPHIGIRSLPRRALSMLPRKSIQEIFLRNIYLFFALTINITSCHTFYTEQTAIAQHFEAMSREPYCVVLHISDIHCSRQLWRE